MVDDNPEALAVTHVPDQPTDFAGALAAAEDGQSLELKSVELSASDVTRLLDALKQHRQSLPAVSFQKCVFTDDVSFAAVTFGGEALFNESQFAGRAGFRKTIFKGDASFAECTFEGDADFDGSQYDGDYSTFAASHFRRDASFFECRFKLADFTAAEFARDAEFRGARFEGDSSHQPGKSAFFLNTRFEGRTSFRDTKADHDMDFWGAKFVGRTDLGITAGGTVDLSGCRVSEPSIWTISADTLELEKAEFEGPLALDVAKASIYLAHAAFRQPSTIASLSGSDHLDAAAGEVPSIMNLRAVDVSNLTLSDVRLDHCRFAGAHLLDGLRLDGAVSFLSAPRGLMTSWKRLRPGYWSRRRVIVEEAEWRSMQGREHDAEERQEQASSGSAVPDHRGDPDPRWAAMLRPNRPESIPTADRLAQTYRSIRKGFEDSKDEPGAADFYYGEMEMRRYGTTSRSMKVLLHIYWAVSGYGLRPLRSLLTLTGVVLAATVLLATCDGFRDGPVEYGWAESAIFALGATVNVFNARTESLYTWAQLLQIFLRIVGPALYLLTALALRGRVKR